MNNYVYIGQAVALNLEITKRILRIGQAYLKGIKKLKTSFNNGYRI